MDGKVEWKMLDNEEAYYTSANLYDSDYFKPQHGLGNTFHDLFKVEHSAQEPLSSYTKERGWSSKLLGMRWSRYHLCPGLPRKMFLLIN